MTRLFALDLRSLATLRVGLGLILLRDLVGRAADLTAHYTDAGVLPRSELLASWGKSLHTLGGSFEFQATLFVIAAIAAFGLLLGFYTRAANFVSCFLLLSLHARNPQVLHGGDVLLRLLLFWSLFLPLGRRWSLDAYLAGESPTSSPVVSAGTAAFILQLCFMYWFSVAHKFGPYWGADGNALYLVLNVDGFTTSFGQSLITLPDDVLRWLTWGTVALEAVGPALLFVPWRNDRLRVAVVFAFIAFHVLGLGLTIELGNFPYVCAAGWIALLPGGFWDALVRRSAVIVRCAGNATPTRSVSEVRRPDLAYASGWCRTACAADNRSDPKTPPQPLPAAGRGTKPSPISDLPAWANAVLFIPFAFVVLINLGSVGVAPVRDLLAQGLGRFGDALGLTQSWNLFAPKPMVNDGWFVVVGTRADGTTVEPFRDGPITWEKPSLVSATYRNERWRKYLMNLLDDGNKRDRDLFAQFLMRDWNARRPDDRLVEVRVYYMLEMTRPNYTTAPAEKLLMTTYPEP